MNIEEPVMTIGRSGVSILSSEIAEKLEKKKISPSLITGVEGCQAAWVANTFVMRDLVEEEQDNAATRGSFFHRVMELAFAEPAEMRGRERINELRSLVLEEEEFSHFAENEDALAWFEDAVDGYYQMGGRPRRVNVATIERDGKEQQALEIRVNGKLGGAERPIVGFIDRLVEDTRTKGGLIVEDWKSGKTAKRWNPKTKSTDGLAEARQQVTYSMLLENEGENVTGARLIFPVARELVEVDINDADFRARVLRNIKEADETLNTMLETNEFNFSPSFLCAWCPLAKACPAAEIGKFQKAKDAVKKQPGLEVLAKGFEFV